MIFKFFLLLCTAATLVPGHYCIEIKSSDDEERSRLPELLTELDVASEEASVEDVKALSKLVKRLASDKNGEYLKIQVIFGDEDMFNKSSEEITGQPGVDYPALTTIPATTFSCRGQRGGYYADLETNCQVFHICDNGRKISFLCPNGTIFQQSQLICDWWFKVDCARSAELYEQSAEYLAEEERKRVEKKKMTSEFHRTNNEDNYHQNLDYDGRQNGRSNPFGQSATQNQLSNDKNAKSTQNNNDVYEKQASKSGNQIQYPNHRYDESTIPRPKDDYRKAQSNRQLNQLYSNDGKNVQTVKFFNHQGKSNQEDVYYGSAANVNAQREDKQAVKSNKPRTFTRQNFNAGVQKVTPVYTEATTFRTSTASPIREFQHLAESAAFVSSRNNGKFKPPNSNQYNNFFTSNKATTSTPQANHQSTATTTGNTLTSPQNLVRSRVTIPPFPGPTYAPIYKPRTTTLSNDEAQSTTLRSYTNTEYFRQNNQDQGTTYRNTESTTNYPDVATTYSPFNFAKNFGEKYTNPPPTDDSGERYTTYAPTTQRPVYVRKETTSRPETTTTNYDSGEYTTHYTDNYSGSFTTVRPVYRDNTAFSAVNDIQADDTARYTPSKFVNNPQNQVAASTERSNNNSSVPRRTPSPYDTSITYQHGKELSTLGPYVPFTKSYAFTTSTTPRPSFVQNFNQLTRNLPVGAKAENYVSSDYGKSGNRATYLPERTTPSPYLNEKSNFDNRPVQEREHALNMLKSLQGLEGTVPNLNLNNINNTSYNFEPKASAGPSTLHSLALYFANTDEDYNTEGPTDSVINFQYFETTPNPIDKKNTSVIDLPTSILTQHTISSYIELFNLNNALENNITGDTSYDMSDDENFADEDSSDLDIQQSEGPLNGVKKSNNTKLRELAQVFTQALSAYLQDPDTFKRVLTEIRPTEPQNIENEITTDIPTTTEDYPSVTKEKDEVLDFSDDINGIRRRRPITTTTVIPETSKNDSNETTYQPYYTPDYFSRTTPYPDESLNEAQSSYTQPKNDNRFAYGGNAVFDSKKLNHVQNYKSSDYTNGKDYSNYLPNEQSRYGGFQNNSATTYSPYGKNVKPSNSTPISDNYVASSTPATYEIAAPQNFVPSQSSIDTNLKLSDVLTPPAFSTSYSVSSTANTAPISTTTKTKSVNTGTSGSNVTPVYKRPQETTTSTTSTTTTSTTTKEPFRIRYYDPTTVKPRKAESLVTASSSNTNFKNNFNTVDSNERKNEKSTSNQKQKNNENNFNKNNHNNQNNHHWTSSPTVTQLWETTVFIDPDHINRGLDSGEPRISQPSSNIDFRSTTTAPRDELFVNDASNSVTPQNFVNDQSTPWQWAPNNNDSPTAFTLLPNINYASNDKTATPTPTYTTRSSITTTITSSITATNAVPPTSPDVPTRISIFNITENEIQMAHNMFGSLNESSSNTLMKVMKQADNNATVRQLVLLLISHCNGPQNKTMEEEKEEVLNALLKLPVNEFTSEESRELIKGISKLHLPLGKDTKSPSTIAATTSAPIPSTTPSEPVVTTYRSRSGRKFKATTVKSNSSYAKVASNNNPRSDRKAKSTEEGTISDSRALDLLRSLYTIAAKWG